MAEKQAVKDVKFKFATALGPKGRNDREATRCNRLLEKRKRKGKGSTQGWGGGLYLFILSTPPKASTWALGREKLFCGLTGMHGDSSYRVYDDDISHIWCLTPPLDDTHPQPPPPFLQLLSSCQGWRARRYSTGRVEELRRCTMQSDSREYGVRLAGLNTTAGGR